MDCSAVNPRKRATASASADARCADGEASARAVRPTQSRMLDRSERMLMPRNCPAGALDLLAFRNLVDDRVLRAEHLAQCAASRIGGESRPVHPGRGAMHVGLV